MTDILKQFVDTANARADANTFKAAAKAMAEHFDAERKALLEALDPFASLGAKIHPDAPDSAPLVLTTLDGGIIDTHNRVTVGDLRRAIAVTA